MKAPYNELGEPKKKFSETFSGLSLFRERWFPPKKEDRDEEVIESNNKFKDYHIV